MNRPPACPECDSDIWVDPHRSAPHTWRCVECAVTFDAEEIR